MTVTYDRNEEEVLSSRDTWWLSSPRNSQRGYVAMNNGGIDIPSAYRKFGARSFGLRIILYMHDRKNKIMINKRLAELS